MSAKSALIFVYHMSLVPPTSFMTIDMTKPYKPLTTSKCAQNWRCLHANDGWTVAEIAAPMSYPWTNPWNSEARTLCVGSDTWWTTNGKHSDIVFYFHCDRKAYFEMMVHVIYKWSIGILSAVKILALEWSRRPKSTPKSQSRHLLHLLFKTQTRNSLLSVFWAILGFLFVRRGRNWANPSFVYLHLEKLQLIFLYWIHSC